MTKQTLVIFLSILFLVTVSCNKRQGQPVSPERDLSMPEKVEKELKDVLSKDWKSLADTLDYFDSTLLRKGKLKGVAPDGVYYELIVKTITEYSLEVKFNVADSTWAAISGNLDPLQINLTACGTEIAIKIEEVDSISLSVSKVKVISPIKFLQEDNHRASLLYDGQCVGYLTREVFENTDYSTGRYLIAHYHNDKRTFAIYDNGLTALLKKGRMDVFE